MKCALLSLVVLVLCAQLAQAQQTTACRVLCTPEFKVEPQSRCTNLFGSPRTIAAGGGLTRERRETEFELILSLGLPTRLSWLDFTVEAIFLPFNADSTPELEFETNFVWLPAERTRGWLSSHFDVVDKFSPAERPNDRRAYTHKLNFELDTSVAIFNRLSEGRWLRGVELEGSLDYVACRRRGTRSRAAATWTMPARGHSRWCSLCQLPRSRAIGVCRPREAN
jgi:hypothetical protein